MESPNTYYRFREDSGDAIAVTLRIEAFRFSKSRLGIDLSEFYGYDGMLAVHDSSTFAERSAWPRLK